MTGNNKTFGFDGFDNAAASTLDIELIGAHLEYMRKNLSPPRARKILKHGTPANPPTHVKDGSTCEDWQALSLVSMLNSAVATSVLSLCEGISTYVDAFLKRLGSRHECKLTLNWLGTATRNSLSDESLCELPFPNHKPPAPPTGRNTHASFSVRMELRVCLCASTTVRSSEFSTTARS